MLMSLLIVLSSVMVGGMNVFAADHTAGELQNLVDSFEQKMDGTAYGNMSAAYQAWYDAKAYLVGAEAGIAEENDVDTYYTALETALANMTEWTSKTADVQPAFGNDTTGTSYDGYVNGDVDYAVNLLYSPVCSDYSANDEQASGTLGDVTIDLYYNTTVLMYDGIHTPTMPVMALASKNTGNNRYIYQLYPAASATDNSDHPDFRLTESWHGASHDGETHNDCWPWTMDLANVTGRPQAFAGTANTSDRLPLYRGGFFQGYAKYIAALANGMQFISDMDAGTYSSAYNLVWYRLTGDDPSDAAYINNTNATIYVVNYKAILDAVSSALENITSYSYNGALSVISAVEACMNFDPNSYDYASDTATAVSACAADINSLVNGVNTAVSAAGTMDAGSYMTLASAYADYTQTYAAGQGNYSDETWTAFVSEYDAATSVLSAVVNQTAYMSSVSSEALVTAYNNLKEVIRDITYTYIFADGSNTTVIAPEGTEPEAPANTAATDWASNNDGTHSRTVYTWPAWESGVTEYTEIATPTQTACSMEETEAQVDPIHKDGQLVDGKTAVMTCTECGYQTGGEVIDAGEHVYELDEEASTAATCVAAGENVYVCTVCGASYTEPTEIDPNNHANVVTDPAVDATCTTPGLTEGSHCEACSTVITAQEKVPALGHDYQISDSTDATCVTPGSVTYTCTRCNDSYTEDGVLDPNNHEGDVALDPETVKEATRGEDGYTGDTVCSACGAVVEKGEVIPALGVQITVTQNELGSTTLNGEATTGTAQKVAYEKSYTLAATANEGAEFIGWQVNGKLVSTDATYTTTAYADTTYVPVFAEAADEFTVTFIDQFNKVIGTYTNAEIAEMEALPEAVSYLGYTFDGWSMTLEEVKALDTNAIVTASYTKDEAVTYTVTAPGCTIIDVANGTQANDALEVAFDSMVTIKPVDGEATAWTVNGANAAYGSEYTFYVTSDVEVAYSSDEVTAQPTVAAVAVEATTGGARFLATRSVPEGYTLIESGFVYGKDVADADTALVLENVGNGCYLYKNSNTAADGQFALTVNTSTPGTLYARAYIMVADSDGVTSVYYADVQNYTI